MTVRLGGGSAIDGVGLPPDGGAAWVSDATGGASIVPGPSGTTLPGSIPERANAYAWSPDGSHLAVARAAGVDVYDRRRRNGRRRPGRARRAPVMEPLTRRGVVRVRYPFAVADDQQREVYSWGGSVGFAIVGTVLAVVLILVFTELEDLVGQFGSQVMYFPTIVFVVVAAALRSRRMDDADPTRLSKPTPITPAGLPGPFVVTQALGRGRHRDDRGRVGAGRRRRS